MTTSAPEAPAAEAAAPAQRTASRGARRLSLRPRRSPARAGGLSVLASGLTLASVLLGAFVFHLAALSAVEHARAQRIGYAQLRQALSDVTAPTGQRGTDGALLDLGTPVAYLDAPALGLQREVVFEGTTAGVMTKGPGHRRSTVLPGQAGTSVIYGRAWSYGGPFGGLANVPVGSEITVTNGQGRHSYRVTGVRRAGDRVPAAPDVTKGEGRLTLVSAEGSVFVPDGAVYLDASLATKPQPAAPLVLGAASLGRAEGVLGTDRAAWPSVFLLMQAFAVTALLGTWAAHRLGPPLAWLLSLPVLVLTAVLAAGQVVQLLPNLL